MSETEKLYKTTFINKRNSRVIVMEYGGKMLMILLEGQTITVESFSALTAYSRWKEIVFLPNEKIEAVENKNWQNPFEGPYFIELKNDEGAGTEMLLVDGTYREAFRGLPRILPVPLCDPLIFFKTIRWKKITEKKPKRNFPQYLETTERIILEKISRSKNEIEGIRAALEQIARRQVALTMKRRIIKSGLDEKLNAQPLTVEKE